MSLTSRDLLQMKSLKSQEELWPCNVSGAEVSGLNQMSRVHHNLTLKLEKDSSEER